MKKSKKIIKAAIINPGDNVRYVDFNFNGTNAYMEGLEGMALGGADYEGMALALFYGYNPNETINILGSTIASYLKDEFWVYDRTINGKIVLTDDNGDMNEDKLKKILNIISCKRLRKVPDKLVTKVKNLEKEAKNTKDGLLKRILLSASDDLKHYGEFRCR